MATAASTDGVDVFISYKRSDRARILPLIALLQQLGISVWFDANLEAGDSFDEEIARQISNARAQLVCWTTASVASRWVRSEAHIGAGRRILIPVFLERCELPPPFNLDHTADLSDWQGEPRHAEWQSVLARLGTLLGRGAALRRWSVMGTLDDSSDLRAFLRDFPADPVAKAAAKRIFELEVASLRRRLSEELQIPDTSTSTQEIDKLRSELSAEQSKHRALAIDGRLQIERLTEQLSVATKDMVLAQEQQRVLQGSLARAVEERSRLELELERATTSGASLAESLAQEKRLNATHRESLAKAAAALTNKGEGVRPAADVFTFRNLAIGSTLALAIFGAGWFTSPISSAPAGEAILSKNDVAVAPPNLWKPGDKRPRLLQFVGYPKASRGFVDGRFTIGKVYRLLEFDGGDEAPFRIIDDNGIPRWANRTGFSVVE